ncbi:uncharacterized protein VTP21DRAFT_7705 [Calcarisporiella thermophila]|uniref:uncharacterized protein n=1 Tax=Calcarisporiella thermophila TaxID=911321 RepID=UPI00374467D6
MIRIHYGGLQVLRHAATRPLPRHTLRMTHSTRYPCPNFFRNASFSPPRRLVTPLPLMTCTRRLSLLSFPFLQHQTPKVLPVQPSIADSTLSSLSNPQKSHYAWFLQFLSFLRRLAEPIIIILRFLDLVRIFFPVIFCSPMLLVGERIPELDGARKGAIWWYRLLAAQMERAGPTFIKLAQWAASRTDLFPVGFCRTVGRLHSQGIPHPFYWTRRSVEAAFNMPLEEIFCEFEEVPLGVGAIAQVHKAKLKLNTQLLSDPSNPDCVVCAIKVLHPNAATSIRRDLTILETVACFINIFPTMSWLSLPDQVREFSQTMMSQLDLRVEASNLETFISHFKDRERVKFPQPILPAHDVLVEEFQRGVPLERFLELGAGEFDAQLAQTGLDAFLHMVIMDNFVHSDLHPGNILVRFCKPLARSLPLQYWARWRHKPLVDDSQSDEVVARLMKAFEQGKDEWHRELSSVKAEGFVPQLVFIDTGLVTVLNGENRRNFLDLFRAVAEFDGYRAGKLMIERCRTPDLVVDGEVFALKMQHLLLSIRPSSLRLRSVEIGDVLHQVMDMVRNHHVRLEGSFINLVMSILLLEGIGRRLNPDMDLLKSALPILRKLGTSDMRGAYEMAKELPESGWWLKVWIFLEMKDLFESRREYDEYPIYDFCAFPTT